MKTSDRIVALARYYKLVSRLERELRRSFRADAVGLDQIHRNIRLASAAHAERGTAHAALLFHAERAGRFALQIERHVDVAHNVARLHASFDRAVAA